MGFQTLIMACQMSYYTSCHLCYVLYQSRISFGSWVCQNHVQTYIYIEIFNQKNYISDKRTHVCRAFSTTPALVEIPWKCLPSDKFTLKRKQNCSCKVCIYEVCQTFWGRHYAWFFVLKCLLTCLIELLQLCTPCGTYDGMASSKSHPHRPKHDYRLKTQTFT